MNGTGGLLKLGTCSEVAKVERALRKAGVSTAIYRREDALPPEMGLVDVVEDSCGHVLAVFEVLVSK